MPPLEGADVADAIAQAQGHDLHPTLDPAQVQHELHTYLIQRGRQLAQDQDLGQVQDHDLEALGRLDCIAQHPNLDPALAQYLEMIAANLEAQALRPSGLRGIVPEASWDGRSNAIDQGQVEHHTQHQPETADRNRKNGQGARPGWVRDPLRDHADEEWS